MQYQYQTLDEDDFWVFMNATLKVKREVAFGKVNLTANAPDIVSGFWVGTLAKIYRSKPQLQSRAGSAGDGPAGDGPAGDGSTGGGGVDSFLQLIEMPEKLHKDSGAPSSVWARFDLDRTEPRINITLSLFNKTRTRLPEAHWMDFELSVPTESIGSIGSIGSAGPAKPAAAAGSGSITNGAVASAGGCESWVIFKLNSSFCATDVSLFGATHVHAVSDAYSGLKWETGGMTVGVRTLDAAVVALEYLIRTRLAI